MIITHNRDRPIEEDQFPGRKDHQISRHWIFTSTVKEIVYQTQINTPQQLMQRICNAIVCISAHNLCAFAAIKEGEEDINNATESIFRRCLSNIYNNGRHFEMELQHKPTMRYQGNSPLLFRSFIILLNLLYTF